MHCTIVMPAHNTEAYIGEAINSVFQQKYNSWDILVVDDASSDGTADVAEKLARGHPVSVIRLQNHIGAAGATRIGIENARGPIITVVDSDDRIFPHALSTVVPSFEQRPKLGWAWTKFVCSNKSGGWTRSLPPGKSLLEALTTGWWACSHQRFLRKTDYLRGPGLRDDIPAASDLQLALVMGATRCDVHFFPVITYWYRVNRVGSISKSRQFQRRCGYKAIAWARDGFKDAPARNHALV